MDEKEKEKDEVVEYEYVRSEILETAKRILEEHRELFKRLAKL